MTRSLFRFGAEFWHRYALYLLLIFGPLVLLDWFLVWSWSHVVFCILLAVVYVVGWPAAGRLQRKFWKVSR